uniref:Uncharacterized protein LOC114345071 n=1 Tax=Diabrotica virgifera virgifera TaxID=50390 RepID=A0A6P7H1W6_DIAVI
MGAGEWDHWKRTFMNFLAAQVVTSAVSADGSAGPLLDINNIKLQLLINHISPRVYTLISDCKTYNESIQTLDKIYIKPNNIIHARHMLTTRRQQTDETIDSYMQSLKQLAKECNFTAVDADTNKNNRIRGSFIAGMTSTKIRSRLLESLTLTLEETYNIAISMEMAELNSQVYASQNLTLSALPGQDTNVFSAVGQYIQERNVLLGNPSESCNKKGHFAKVYRSKSTSASTNVSEGYDNCTACVLAATPASLKKAVVPAFIKGLRADALIDTGSSVSFVNEDFANICKLPRKPCMQTVSMASLSHSSQVKV